MMYRLYSFSETRNLPLLLRRAASGLLAVCIGAVSLSAQQLSPGNPPPLSDRDFDTVGGGATTLRDAGGPQGLVVAFWANSCPWVERYEDRFKSIAGEFATRGIGFVAVNSNDPVSYPEDQPDRLEEQSADGKYAFDYLVDETGALARAFGAKRTPEVYVFNSDMELVYAGAIDDSPAMPEAVGKPYLKNALASLLSGGSIEPAQAVAIGCTIKLAPQE